MNRANLTQGVEQAWASFMLFLPKLLLAIIIVVAGYFIAKLLCRGLGLLLNKAGFDRLVERGGVKRVLSRTPYDASTFLAKVLFYAVFLIALQLAFGVFGPNPISDILSRIVGYLPNVFVAVLMIIVAAAIGRAVQDILRATLAGLSYGALLATVASALIIGVGFFAALNELRIAPAIVNGLFYAILAIIAGSAIVAIGGGGIIPMRGVWERTISRVERERPALQDRTGKLPDVAKQRAETWKEETSAAAETPPRPAGDVRSFSE